MNEQPEEVQAGIRTLFKKHLDRYLDIKKRFRGMWDTCRQVGLEQKRHLGWYGQDGLEGLFPCPVSLWPLWVGLICHSFFTPPQSTPHPLPPVSPLIPFSYQLSFLIPLCPDAGFQPKVSTIYFPPQMLLNLSSSTRLFVACLHYPINTQ